MSPSRSRQSIRYLRASDGVRLAWAEAGSGPTLVKAANWLSHLELEWQNPVWRHWIEFLSSYFRLVRYDERGCGMSDWEVGDLGQERWAADLEAVVEAADCREPIILLGISQGGAPAIEFAVRHPERVSHLILYGCYSQGWMKRGSEADLAGYEVVWRDTTEPDWTHAIAVGKVTSASLPNAPKDNYFFGVRALDTSGHRSPVAFPEPDRGTEAKSAPAAKR